MLLADDRLMKKVEKVVEEANEELKKVDSQLSARLIKVPVGREALQEGELYEKIRYVIMYHIVKAIHDRIKGIKSGVLKKRSKESIKQLLNRLKELNILRDKEIDVLIESIEFKLNMTVKQLREEIIEQLEYIEKILSS
ncbi:MAG TPA: hypothetical protein ENG16_00930 [Archaeoglobus sp.]|nr:hypothetical protein [Archaeoglobus sp.]